MAGRVNEDCYFYCYSTCRKGEECKFRHEPLSLLNETVCKAWMEGKCNTPRCPLRHLELKLNRHEVQCFWENKSGCKKAHCPFKHDLPRTIVKDPATGKFSLIANGKAGPSTSAAVNDASEHSASFSEMDAATEDEAPSITTSAMGDGSDGELNSASTMDMVSEGSENSSSAMYNAIPDGAGDSASMVAIASEGTGTSTSAMDVASEGAGTFNSTTDISSEGAGTLSLVTDISSDGADLAADTEALRISAKADVADIEMISEAGDDAEPQASHSCNCNQLQ